MKRWRVLVACEFSGIVREAFRALGWNAWSCDLLPTEQPGRHLIGDVRRYLHDGWDLLIAHPPCTYLSASGARWWAQRKIRQRAAVHFVLQLLHAPIPHIALENPIGVLSTVLRKPDQIVQPYQFGHGEVKATCFWLLNLPHLVPTHTVSGRDPTCHYQTPSPNRWKIRSRTYLGIARAMAQQWGDAVQRGACV